MKMRFLLLLCSMFFLVACGADDQPLVEEAPTASAPTLAPRPTEAPAATPTLVPTAEPIAPTAAPVQEQQSAETSTSAQASGNKPTYGVAPFPAASPQEAYGIRADDHLKGAQSPDILIIEYGDFQ